MLNQILNFYKINYPKFWKQNNNFVSKIIILILLPLSILYFFVSLIKKKLQTPNEIGVPIICVGNLVTGGSGKTPVVLFLIKFFKKKKINVHVITRGYGGKLKGPTRVDNSKHSYLEVGDEALMLSKEATVWVSKNRFEGAFAATLSGADLIIFDDGLQNYSVEKDLNIIVVDGGFGFGNNFIMPAGPLRENISSGIKKSQLLILLDDDKNHIEEKVKKDITVIKGKSIIKNYKKIKKRKIVAFAGIGRPEKFLNSLKEKKLTILKFFPFPDHYVYKNSDLNKIINYSKKNGGIPITTLKDKQRISKNLRKEIHFIDLEIKLNEEKKLNHFLKLKKIA